VKSLTYADSEPLSYLERRWLAEGFAKLSVIDGRYLTVGQTEDEIGIGSFGRVVKGKYNKPGIPGIVAIVFCLIRLEYEVAIKRVHKKDDLTSEEEYTDAVSRLAMEAVVLRRAAGPNVASLLCLMRFNGSLMLITYK
jgi:serine/threonine protein kinase